MMSTNTAPIPVYEDVKTKPYDLTELNELQSGWNNHGMH